MNSTLKFLCIALLTATSGPAFAQDMSGWSDTTVCRLVSSNPGNLDYIGEATSRSLKCIAAVVSKKSEQVPDTPYRLRDAWTEQQDLPIYYSAAGGIWTGTQNCYIHFNKGDKQERDASCFISRVFDGHIQEKANLDFTGDGIRDKIIIGVVNADNERSTHENYQSITDQDISINGRCTGGKGSCIVTAQMPIFLQGKADGTFIYRNDLLIDDTGEQGQNYYHQIVPADFNGDGTLDVYVWGLGVDLLPHFKGVTGSYFLSQPNGTWLESTETHMTHWGRVWTAFNHGVTAGDIDGDGDIDIIETMIEHTKTTGLWCRINDGTGKMKMKSCGGGQDGWGVQAGDLDGDGCLDAVQSGGYGHWNGVSWGNCSGRFKKSHKSKFNAHRLSDRDDPEAYGEVLETWLWDLDNDGDLDIVAGHVGQSLYVGAALSIHENLGNRTFKEVSFIEFNKRPDTAAKVKHCHKGGEGNPCSAYLKWVDFMDVDGDGLFEIVMSSHAPQNNRVAERMKDKFEWQITGSIVRNTGNMNFTWEKTDNYAANYSKWAKHRLVEQSGNTTEDKR